MNCFGLVAKECEMNNNNNSDKIYLKNKTIETVHKSSFNYSFEWCSIEKRINGLFCKFS